MAEGCSPGATGSAGGLSGTLASKLTDESSSGEVEEGTPIFVTNSPDHVKCRERN